jgi:hypothetical protein
MSWRKGRMRSPLPAHQTSAKHDACRQAGRGNRRAKASQTQIARGAFNCARLSHQCNGELADGAFAALTGVLSRSHAAPAAIAKYTISAAVPIARRRSKMRHRSGLAAFVFMLYPLPEAMIGMYK